MGTFDEMLASLHQGKGASLQDTDNKVISIDEKRRFVVPEGYNLELAYEGDVNSQIVTFCLPKVYEGHDLVSCDIKGIKWKNKSSGNEDWSELIPFIPSWIDKKTAADFQFFQWIVPPTAFTKAGILEISISLYDFQDNKLAFSWNTASFSGFTVQSTFADVGYKGEAITHFTPARNEILFINEENHNIVAPQGYNFVFSVYGSKNTALLHFQSPSVLGGINMLDSDTKISIIVKMKNIIETDVISQSQVHSSFYNTTETGKGLVEFDWLIPDWITYNGSGYNGTITISLVVENGDKTKIWKTSPFTKLILERGDEDISAEKLSTEYHTIIDASHESRPAVNKIFSGTISFKQMTEAEWTNSTYVPYNKEIIIYGIDGNYNSPRIKIGNGLYLAKDLPFVMDPTIPSWAREEVLNYTYELTEADVTKIIDRLREELGAAEEYEG